MQNFEGLNVNNKFFIDYVTSEKAQEKEDDSTTNESIWTIQEKTPSTDGDLKNLPPTLDNILYKTIANPSDNVVIGKKTADADIVQTLAYPSDDGLQGRNISDSDIMEVINNPANNVIQGKKTADADIVQTLTYTSDDGKFKTFDPNNDNSNEYINLKKLYDK